jgi:hypothetical protein
MTNPNPQQQKDEPLRCPCCNGGSQVGSMFNYSWRWRVLCEICLLSTDWCGTAAQAIKRWNKRSPQPPPLPLQDKAITENTFGQSAASRDQALDEAIQAVKVAYRDYSTLKDIDLRAKYGTRDLQDVLVAAVLALKTPKERG